MIDSGVKRFLTTSPVVVVVVVVGAAQPFCVDKFSGCRRPGRVKEL